MGLLKKLIFVAGILSAVASLGHSAVWASPQIEYLVVVPADSDAAEPKENITPAQLMASTVLYGPSEKRSSQHRLVKQQGKLSALKARLNASKGYRSLVHGVVPGTQDPLAARYVIGDRNSPTHHELWITIGVSADKKRIIRLASSFKLDVPGAPSAGLARFSPSFESGSILAQKRVTPGAIYLFNQPAFAIFLVLNTQP